MHDQVPPGGVPKSAQAPEDFARLRFLIVDDNAFVRGIVQSMLLKNKSKNVTHAENGQEALELLTKMRFDCIISDWNMAPVGGLELLRRVRTGQAPPTPSDICFILLTGHADAKVVNIAINLDVNAYLVKPISFEKLTQAITNTIARKVQVKGPKFYEAIPGVELTPGT